MHIVLTDILTCPRCGPEYGLVLLADRVEERRVRTGALGCPNCREKYAVEAGAARFGGGAPSGLPTAAAAAPEPGERGDAEAALRLGALLGVTHGPGFILVVGPAAVHGRALAELIEDIEVVAVTVGSAAAETAASSEPGVNPLVLDPGATRLPVASGKVPAVALTGELADTLLEEGVRVLSPVGRLVLDPAPGDVAERLAALKLRMLAQDGGTVVAARY